jgi:cell wall-associated NlpC family hydrolase
LDQIRPGDLLFWGTDRNDSRSINHVGMYIGGGWGINSGGTGTGVNIRNIPRTSGWIWPDAVRPG